MSTTTCHVYRVFYPGRHVSDSWIFSLSVGGQGQLTSFQVSYFL